MIIWGSKKGDWKRGRTEVYNSRIKTKWKYSQFPPYWKYFSGLFFNHKMESVLSSHLGLIYYQVCLLSKYVLEWNESQGFPGRWLSGEEPTCQAGESGLIPGLGNPLEKEIATYSSILPWEIPWTEEPGGLQSMWLQKSWTWLSN